MIQSGLFEDYSEPQEISLERGRLTCWPCFLSDLESRSLFDVLYSQLAWEQSEIQVYGRSVLIPRLNAWYADEGCDYAYSGKAMTRLDWHSLLFELKGRIEQTTGKRFNSVLANCYRDGDDSVGWHSDDERELGKNPAIASLSLGVTRRFLLKHRNNKELRHELALDNGSLLLMSGETQHFWYHSVPKEPRVKDARINLTFRYICR